MRAIDIRTCALADSCADCLSHNGCAYGGIGRHATLSGSGESRAVQVLLSAPIFVNIKDEAAMSIEKQASKADPRSVRGFNGPKMAKLLPWLFSAVLLSGCANRTI